MPSNHIIFCHSLLFLPSVFPSIKVFSKESVLHIRWTTNGVLSSASVLPMHFQDWFPLGLTLAVQGTLKSLLQHHSALLRHSAFFMVQLSHPYVTTGKTIALTRQIFVRKVMYLLFMVIAFLPRSKCLSISWQRLPSAVILELKKIKSVTDSIVSPPVCHEVMEPDAMILVFWMLTFKPASSVSSFTLIKRLQFLFAFCLKGVSSA